MSSGLRRVAAFEWRLLRAERTLWPLVLLLVAGVGYAARNGGQWVGFQRHTIGETQVEEHGRLERLAKTLDSLAADTSALRAFGDPRNPYVAGQSLARRYTPLPPAPLAALAVGQSDLFPAYYRVSMASRETFLSNDEVENPVHLAVGRFDLAFVVVYLFPLIVIALTYNLLSADREGGTLALLGSQPVSLGAILGGKLLTRGFVIVALAVVMTFAGALIAGVRYAEPGTIERLVLWLGITTAYGAFWLFAALLVNVVGRSSATNALALLGCWLVAVVLIPSGLVAWVNATEPTPSRVELMTATREASNSAAARGGQLLGMYYQDHPELMRGGAPGLNEFGTRAMAVSQEVDRLTRPIVARFDTVLAAQQALVDRWRFVSPALATHDALITLAGTSGERYADFQRQVDRYVRELDGYFAPMIVRGERFTRPAIAGLPAFVYREQSASGVYLRAAGGGLGALAATALVILLTRRRLSRLTVVEA